jgi:hypothetical protein
VIATAEFFVCQGCGLVVEDMPLISNAPVFHLGKDKKPQISSAPRVHAGTVIGSKNETTGKFRKLNRIQHQLTSNSTTEAFHILSMIKSHFNVGIPTDHFVDVFKHLYPIMPLKTLGRNKKKLSGIIFYRLTNTRHVRVTLGAVLDYCEISKSDYNGILQTILRVLPTNSPYRSIFRRQTKKEYYQDLLYALHHFYTVKRLPDHIITLSKKLLYYYGQDFGSKISIKASTAITLALQYYKVRNIKTYKVAKILGCSPSTVYKRVNMATPFIRFDRLVPSAGLSRINPPLMIRRPVRNIVSLGTMASVYNPNSTVYPRISSLFAKDSKNLRRRGVLRNRSPFIFPQTFKKYYASPDQFQGPVHFSPCSSNTFSFSTSDVPGECSFSPPIGYEFSPPIS